MNNYSHILKDEQMTGDHLDQSAPYPTEEVQNVALNDGAQVLIRPIRPDDAHLLQEGFTRLSPQTIYLRFFQDYKELGDQQAQRFARVDYRRQMALVGEVQENGAPRLVASARYTIVDPVEAGLAEMAIVVADDYQGRGLGTLIMARLIHYARQHSVQAFLGIIHVSNKRILKFISKSGLPSERTMIEPGVWQVKIYLTGVAAREAE
jgi:RimJ/RimL family protein N-acetyltransferase